MMNALFSLYQFAFIVFLYMGFRVLFRQHHSTLNRVFFSLSVSLAIWSFTTGYMLVATSQASANAWRQFSTLGFCLMPALFLHFFMLKTRFKPLRTCAICPGLLYLPGLTYILIAFFNPQAFAEGQYVLMAYGWTFLSSGSWLDWSYNLYYSSYFVIGFSLLIHWLKKANKKREKSQARLIILSLVLAFIFGSLTDTVLPVLQIPAPPLAVLFALIPAFTLWYTIEKYRAMGLSSQNIVSDILKNMGEGLLLLDMGGRIREISDETLNLLACTRDDLMLKSVSMIVAESDVHRISHLLDKENRKPVRNLDINLRRCDGKTFPAIFSMAPVFDDWNDVLGHICTFRDHTEEQKNEEQIRASLREKEILLAEIHHRVKNNLQLINSLVNMQQNLSNEENTVLKSVKSRIRAISLVHEKLFRTQNVEAIDFSDFLKDLISHLSMSYKKPGLQIQTHIHVDHVVLPLEQATPCSLILNEIISNAFKYGFTGQESGALRVSFVQEKEQYVLTVKNDGKTMPKHAVESETFGLGMKITQALVQQLKGSLDIQHSGGTTFRIQFPKMNTSVPPRF